jgi:hypothetical protein
VKIVPILCPILVVLLGACGSGNQSTLSAKNDAGGSENCEPGAVLENLSEKMKISFQGSQPEGISRLYDAFFVAMKKCDRARDLDFSARQEWAPSGFNWLSPMPDLPPFRYFMRVSKEDGLCLSRIGLEPGSNRKPVWYCERRGWMKDIEKKNE